MLDMFRRLALVGAVVGLGGCSLWGGSNGYKMSASTQTLQVPPQLSPPKAQSTYAVPPASGLGPQGETAQSMTQGGQGGVENASQPGVLPKVPGMQLQQAGAFRWLVVDEAPGKIWTQVLAFFKARGFGLSQADIRSGVIRTDWKESEHGLPKGMFADVISNVYYSGARDRYVVRLVRGANDSTDVYLSHQGAIRDKDSQGDLVWQWLPPNPGKEASLLQALMVDLGAPQAEAQKAGAATTSSGPSVYALSKEDGSTVLKADQPFAQAWPQIGLGLDRVDLVVEQQDSAQGLYHVTYVGNSRSNALQNLFGAGSVLQHGTKFQIKVVTEGAGVTVRALDAKGKPLSPKGAHEVLKLLLSGL